MANHKKISDDEFLKYLEENPTETFVNIAKHFGVALSTIKVYYDRLGLPPRYTGKTRNRAEYEKQYRENNREKLREYNRVYRKEWLEKKKA